jgi:DNA (cytosine-5)-methyltransferase 1
MTLPTPCARDGKGPGYQYGLPDLIEGGNRRAELLPTPTSGGGTGYLSGNRRDTWRPTLDLAVQGYRPTKNGRPDRPEGPALLPITTNINTTSQKAQTGRPTSGPSRGEPSFGLQDVVNLLPTPRATDTGTAGRRAGDGFRPPLS